MDFCTDLFLQSSEWIPVLLMDETVMRALGTQDGAMHDNYKEPLVDSLDQIAAVHEWNRLLLHGPQPLPRSKVPRSYFYNCYSSLKDVGEQFEIL